MTRRRVPLFDNIKRVIWVEDEATIGATVGKDLKWPNGQVVKEAELRGNTSSGQPNLVWRLIREVPARVKALAATTGAGFVSLTSKGAAALRAITGTADQIDVSNGDGSTGNPVISLSDLPDSGAGSFKLLTRDAKGRLSGTDNGTAADVPYDNTASGLTATHVQDAIDEVFVAAQAGGGGGGGYAEGTSFPPSPVANQKFYRTDLNLLCYYDGTRWLTVQEYELSISMQGALAPASSSTTIAFAPVRQDFGLYLTRWVNNTFIAGGSSNASNYWLVRLGRVSGANAASDITNFSTAADVVSTNANHDQVINAVLDPSARYLQTLVTKNGSPGPIYLFSSLCYRLIIV